MELHLHVYRETVGYCESLFTVSWSAPVAVLLSVKRTWRYSLLKQNFGTFLS